MAGQYAFVDFAKEDASRLEAQTQAAKGAFEFGAEKKAYADKQAESKEIASIFNDYVKGQAPAAPQKADAGPGGYDPKTGTTGEDRAQMASFKDEMANGQAQNQQYAKESQMLSKLMLAAAKNNDPEGALKFKSQLDGLADKMADSQDKQLKTAKDMYEVQGQLANSFLASPTNENWITATKEAMRLGIPGAEGMMSVPPQQREEYAKAIAKRALTANQAVADETKRLNLASKEKHQQELMDIKNKELVLKQRRITDQRNIASAKLALDKTKLTDAEKKEAFGEANKAHKSSLDTFKFFETKDQKLDSLIKDYEKGNILGLDEKETAAKLTELRSEKSDNQREIEAARKDLSESEAILDKAKSGSGDTKTTKPDANIESEKAEAMKYYNMPGADKKAIAAEFKKRTGKDLVTSFGS